MTVTYDHKMPIILTTDSLVNLAQEKRRATHIHRRAKNLALA